MIKAVSDRVFIRLDTAKDKTSGGVILPEDAAKPRTEGVVESIGPKVSSVKKGDRVLFHIFDELPSYDKDVVVVRESSVLGVFENDE